MGQNRWLDGVVSHLSAEAPTRDAPVHLVLLVLIQEVLDDLMRNDIPDVVCRHRDVLAEGDA